MLYSFATLFNSLILAKKKRKRMEALAHLQNVFQLPDDVKGKWNNEIFHNNGEIILELACGKGEYCIAMAQVFPAKNFLGMDIKGARIWRGATEAARLQLKNVAYIRAYIDHIEDYFSSGEITEIWITFPDPYLSKSKTKKRLTSSVFLSRYRKILKPGGILHLKTDDEQLYEFTLQTIHEQNGKLLLAIPDVYASATNDPLLMIKTFYEKQHLAAGKTIKYLQFQIS